MNQEHFGLIVGFATIGAFLLELAKVLYAVCKKLSSRRMARKGEKDTPINSNAGVAPPAFIGIRAARTILRASLVGVYPIGWSAFKTVCQSRASHS